MRPVWAILVLWVLVWPSAVRAQTSQPLTVELSIDRGDYGLYYIGDPLTLCLGVSRPSRVRLVHRSGGLMPGATETVMGEIFFEGRRCTTSALAPPAGHEELRVEVVDGSRSPAQWTVHYRTIERSGSAPTPLDDGWNPAIGQGLPLGFTTCLVAVSFMQSPSETVEQAVRGLGYTPRWSADMNARVVLPLWVWVLNNPRELEGISGRAAGARVADWLRDTVSRAWAGGALPDVDSQEVARADLRYQWCGGEERLPGAQQVTAGPPD